MAENNNEAMVADYYRLDADGRPTSALCIADIPFACGAEVQSLNNETEILFGELVG